MFLTLLIIIGGCCYGLQSQINELEKTINQLKDQLWRINEQITGN